MLITTLDFPVARPDVIDSAFDRPETVAGAELCVWNTAGMLARFRHSGETDDGRRVPGPVASQQLVADTRALRDAFDALLSRGGTLAVLNDSAAGGVHTLQEIVDFDPLEAIPGIRMRGLPLGADRGPSAWERGQPFGDFFAGHATRLAPNRRLAEPAGRTIGRVAGAPVACFAYRHPGRLLVLPGPAAGLDATSRGELLDGLRTLARRLDPSRRAAALPGWIGALSLPGEPALRTRIATLAQTALDAQRALDAARAELARLDDARLLAAGDADSALATLASVVVALGGVPHPEVDMPGALAFEVDGRAAVLAIAAPQDTDAVTLAARVREAAAAARAELGQPASAILVDASQNDRPPASRQPVTPLVERAAALAGAAAIGSIALLNAWASRDAAVLDGLLGPGADRRRAPAR